MKTEYNYSGPEIINAGKTSVRKPTEDIVTGAGNQDQLEGLKENAARKSLKNKKIGTSPDIGREPKNVGTEKYTPAYTYACKLR